MSITSAHSLSGQRDGESLNEIAASRAYGNLNNQRPRQKIGDLPDVLVLPSTRPHRSVIWSATVTAGHGQISTGTVGQSRAEAPGRCREGIAAQGQAGDRTGYGTDLHQGQDADNQRGPADRHHEDGLDARRRVGRILELSAPRNCN